MLRADRTTPAPVKAGRARPQKIAKIARTPPLKKTGATKPDRKAAILLAAEKLFAQRGYHAVSIRQIADEAGVPLALVGYHYGPKQDLFYAIFQHWSPTIEERLLALQRVNSAPRDEQTLTRIIEAFIGPVLRMRASAEGEYYALLVARELLLALEETDRVLRDFFDPVARTFIDALTNALPGAARVHVAWAYQFALGALLHHLSDTRIERLSNGEVEAGDASAHALLLRFIEAGIRAAVDPRAVPPASPLSLPLSSTRTRK